MEYLIVWQNLLLTSISNTAGGIIKIGTYLIGVLLFLFIGLSFAYWTSRLFVYLAGVLKVNKFEEKINFNKYISRSGFDISLTEVLAYLASFIIFLPFFASIIDLLGLSEINEGIKTLFAQLPLVIEILSVGFAGSIFAYGFIYLFRILIGEKIKLLESFIKILIGVFTLSVIYELLPLPLQFTNNLTYALPYAILLSLSLAVGLSLKNLLTKIVEYYFRNRVI